MCLFFALLYCDLFYGTYYVAANDAYVGMEILSAENQEELDLMQDKISNMTIQEMSEKRSYSRETVRR